MAQGMNLGAACFARRPARHELAGYTEERRLVGRRRIALREGMLASRRPSASTTILLRNAAARMIGHLGFLQRPVLERVARLKE